MGTRTMRTWRLAVAVPVALALLAGACGDEDGEGADDDIEEAAEDTAALGVAEALRASLLLEDSDGNGREVAVIQEAVDNLPGRPDVVGIEDADGDGIDDDGRVEVRVDQEAACLTIDEGGGLGVDANAC